MAPLAAILAATLAAGPGPGTAEAPVLPLRQRTLLMLRVLVYDRNLGARAPKDVVVAVLFRPGDPDSERELGEVLQALAQLSDEVVANGRTIRGTAVPYTTPAELSEQLKALHAASAWVCAALAPQAPEIARITQARKVLSATGVRGAVEAGLAIGIVPGTRRATILVNAAAAKAEGADLDAALLGIAEIVGGGRK